MERVVPLARQVTGISGIPPQEGPAWHHWIHHLPSAAMILASGRVVAANAAAHGLLAPGIPEPGGMLADLWPNGDRDRLEEALRAVATRGGSQSVDLGSPAYTPAPPDSGKRWLRLALQAHGPWVIALGHDLTAERRALTEAQAQAREARRLLDTLPDMVFRADASGRLRAVNQAATLLGYAPEDLSGRPLGDLCADRAVCADFLRRLDQALGARVRAELPLRHAAGHVLWMDCHAHLRRRPDGYPAEIEGVMRDITARRDLEERLRHMAAHDPLTGLPNRALFSARLERAMARAQRRTESLALMFIDLDGFKPINDLHGHEAGDRVLAAVADRLQRVVRTTDTACRLGGDEFTIILENDPSPAFAEMVAERVLTELRRPYTAGSQQVRLSCSIGIAFYPGDGSDGDTLLSHADAAMYAAKRGGRDRWCVWTADLSGPDGIEY